MELQISAIERPTVIVKQADEKMIKKGMGVVSRQKKRGD